MIKRLVKGSKAAKDFMAKIRAKKSNAIKKVKKITTGAKKAFREGYYAKDKVNGVNRKTVDVYEIYGYYPTGKENVFTASSYNEAKQILKDYRNNEPKIKFTMAGKRQKIGSTLLIEKGENPRKKPTRVIQVDRTKKGLFKKFRKVSGIGALNGVNDVKKLKQLATSSKSPLFKRVASILAAKKTNGGYDTLESVFRDVSMGLQSGIISELIYYSDTTKWYKKYKKEIAKMLMNSMNEMGVDSLTDVFGKNWDKTDPFAEDTQNQNLLAWYSFEETARDISYSLGYEL
jgi:hypothetical protein